METMQAKSKMEAVNELRSMTNSVLDYCIEQEVLSGSLMVKVFLGEHNPQDIGYADVEDELFSEWLSLEDAGIDYDILGLSHELVNSEPILFLKFKPKEGFFLQPLCIKDYLSWYFDTDRIEYTICH